MDCKTQSRPATDYTNDKTLLAEENDKTLPAEENGVGIIRPRREPPPLLLTRSVTGGLQISPSAVIVMVPV